MLWVSNALGPIPHPPKPRVAFWDWIFGPQSLGFTNLKLQVSPEVLTPQAPITPQACSKLSALTPNVLNLVALTPAPAAPVCFILSDSLNLV